jgi:hypothetical protein
MSTSNLVKQLKIPAVGSDVWVDVLIGQAQFGMYTVTLYDQNGKNPQLVGSGNNVDTLPDLFKLDTSSLGLANRLLGWTITIASPEEPNGQLYFARIIVRDGSTSLSAEPIEYSGELDNAKILIGFAKFSTP